MSLYNEMENQIIGDIARRVAKTGRLTETAELQAEALREQGYSPSKILSEVRKTLNADDAYMNEVAYQTKEYKEEVANIIKNTVSEAQKAGDTLVGSAGMMSYRDDLRLWKKHGVSLKGDNTLVQLINAYTQQTNGTLKNLTRSSGSLTLNGAKLMNAYRHELDLALIKTVSGGFSFQKAMDDCCHNLARNGISVKYPSGKSMSIEAAVRMCLKTGISQLSGKITESNIKKTGVSLVYVSAHAGARPEHQEWQGQVYTYSGTPSSKYPDFVDSTGYGTVTGLKGVNCSHEFYPHWEGDVIPDFKEPDPVKINGKDYTFYEATQEQRRMERKARALKREIEAQRAVGNEEKLSELNKKLKETKKEYNQFSTKAGLRPKTERMNITDNFHNNKKTLDSNPRSSIIKPITVEDVKKTAVGSGITQEVADKTAQVLEKHNALYIFDDVRSVREENKSALNTVAEQAGTFFDIVFEFNETTIGGMSVEEIDALFAKSKNTVANSLEDAIVHEIYHARLINGLNYAQLEALYDELDSIHIDNFSSEASKSGAECIAEVGVMIERGEIASVSKEAIDLYEKYMGKIK